MKGLLTTDQHFISHDSGYLRAMMPFSGGQQPKRLGTVHTPCTCCPLIPSMGIVSVSLAALCRICPLALWSSVVH